MHPWKRGPGATAVRLMDGWKKQDRDIALGRTILNGDETVGYLVFAINSSRFQPALDQADTQILIADRFGRIFLSNTYNFTDKSNRDRSAGGSRAISALR